MNVTLLLIEPYHPVTGLLVPLVAQRILGLAQERQRERDPGKTARDILTRLYAGDLSLRILGFLDDKGVLVGHAVATIETDGVNHWMFIQQVKVDGDVGDAVGRGIEIGDQWATAVNPNLVARGYTPITKMVMATHRSDAAFQRKYLFTTDRHLMIREIGASKETK